MSITNNKLLVPILLVLYEIATYLSNDMYLPALPQMMRDLGLSINQAQFTLTIWFLGEATMPIVMGILADRFGRRPVLLVGGVFYLLSTALCMFATNLSMLLVGRFVEGAMVASMLVPGYAWVHESFQQKEAVKILALMASVSVLAPAFGPLLGAGILLFSSWRSIFAFIFVWSAVALFFLYRFMPETVTHATQQPLHVKTLASQYGRILRNKRFMLQMCILGLIYAAFIAWITAGPLLVIHYFNYSSMQFGFIQAVIFVAYIIGNRFIKHLLAYKSVAELIFLGLGVAFIGSVCIFLSAILFKSLIPFLIAMTLFSFGSALCFAPLNRTIIEESTESMGARVAFFAVALTSFAALGSGLASMYFNGSMLSLAYLITGAMALACLLKLSLNLFSKVHCFSAPNRYDE